jgi:hypothetical protein
MGRAGIYFWALWLIVCIGCDSKPSATGDGTAPANKSAGPSSAVPAPTGGVGSPKWAAEQTIYDFGEVWAGEQIEYPFQIMNQGDQTLKVLDLKAGCGCSTAEGYAREIAPSKTGAITFRLNTSGKHGAVDENIVVKVNDPERPEITLRMRGIVRQIFQTEVIADAEADRSADPKEALSKIKGSGGSIGAIRADQRIQRTIKLRNTSGRQLAVRFGGIRPDNSRFHAEFQETVPNEEYQLIVYGDPPWQPGQNVATAVIETNVPGRPFYNVGLYAYVPGRIEVQPSRVAVDPAYPYVRDRRIVVTDYGAGTRVAVTDPKYTAQFMSAGEPRQRIVKITLPEEPYAPPPYGELIRLETTDAEKKIIDVYVLPSLDRPPIPRPEDKPLQWTTLLTRS